MQRTLVPVVLACVVAMAATGCGNTATCEGCTSGSVAGLALISLDAIPTGACVPTQIVTSATAPHPFDAATTLELLGDINWYASSSCNLRATTTTIQAGTLGTVAFMSSRTAGKRVAEASNGGLGARKTIQAVTPGTGASNLVIGGARYSDVLVCMPYWVQALDASGAVANVDSPLNIALTGPRGATFYADSTCATVAASVTVSGAGAAFFAQYAIPVTGELSAAADGFTAAAFGVTVSGEVVERLKWTPNDDTVPSTAGSCASLTIGIVDLTGQPLDVEAHTINVVPSEGLTLYTDSACSRFTRTVVIEGLPPTTFYARANTTGSFTVTASADNFDTLTRQVQVVAGSGKGLAFTTPAKIASGGCYPASVDVVDTFGNPPSDNVPQPVVLAGSTRIAIYTDAACTVPATTVTTADNTFPIYLKGSGTAVGATLSATAPGFVSGTGSVDVVAAGSKLTLSSAANVGAGVCSPLIVGAVDSANNPADVIANRAVTLVADARLAFYSDAKCVNGLPTGGAAIPALSRGVTVYVTATVAMTYTVDATAPGMTAAPTLSINVTGGATAVLLLSADPLRNVGSCQAVTGTFNDANGNVTSNDKVRSFALTVTAGGGLFYNNAACTTPAVPSVTVSATASSLMAYYKTTVAETPTISVKATDLPVATVKLDIDFLLYRVRANGDSRPVFRRIAVDPTLTPARLWAQTTEGWLWKTDDRGATWTRYCDGVKGLLNDAGQILVSGAADHTAYLVFGTTVQRIDATSGACPAITAPTVQGASYTNRDTGSFGIAPDGRLYFWGYLATATPPAQLWTSTNQGASWTNVYKDSASNGAQFGIVLNPLDGVQQLVQRNGVTAGLYRSITTGSSFDLVSGTPFTGTPVAMRYDPAHTGYIYSTSRVSADGGLTFAVNGTLAFSGSWAIDTSGALYRSVNGTLKNTFNVQRATNGTVASVVWTMGGVINEPYNAGFSGLSVKADGTLVAVLTNGRIWTSIDNGTSYTATIPPADASSVTAWVTALNETTAYAMDNVWRTYKTIDGGLTWTSGATTVATTIFPFIHISETHPSDVYMRPENFGSMTDTTLNAAHDAFVTNVGALDRSQAAGTQTGAVSLTNPLLFYQIGSSTFRTTDGGVTGTKLTVPALTTTAAHAAVGAVNPTDDTKVFIISPAGDLAVFDATALTVTVVAAADPLNAAALELYSQGSGFILRTVGATGSLTASADFGATFGVSTTPSAATPSCNPRLLASASADHTRVATACPGSTTVSVTANGGTAWVNKAAGCAVRQLSVVSNGFIAACNGAVAESRFVPF